MISNQEFANKMRSAAICYTENDTLLVSDTLWRVIIEQIEQSEVVVRCAECKEGRRPTVAEDAILSAPEGCLLCMHDYKNGTHRPVIVSATHYCGHGVNKENK